MGNYLRCSTVVGYFQYEFVWLWLPATDSYYDFNHQIKEPFSTQYFLHYSHRLLSTSVATTNMDPKYWFEFVTVDFGDLPKIS